MFKIAGRMPNFKANLRELVRDGAKTETRRIEKPLGRAGEYRVMREPLMNVDGIARYVYDRHAVNIGGKMLSWHWSRNTLPAMFMPTSAGRVVVRYTDIHEERLHDIDDAGALAEGIVLRGVTRYEGEAVEEFATLWDSINAERGYPWGGNPLVWVLKWVPVAESVEL